MAEVEPTVVDVSEDPQTLAADEEMDLANDAKNAFAVAFVLLQILITVLYFAFTGYGSYTTESAVQNAGQSQAITSLYASYINVALMVWVGFGFMYAYLRRYGYSAIGFNMLISCFALEWAILVVAFFMQAANGTFQIIELSISNLIQGSYATAAVMITFGALLGKVSPLQMLLIAFIEVILYAVNCMIGGMALKAVDMGGAMFIHTFGAYFGVACAWILRPERPVGSNDQPIAHELNSSSPTSDTFAMVGTLFLWILWPSFNAAQAPLGSQYRVVISTVLALVGSAISAFAFSRLLAPSAKFNMMIIQRATLAGGIAIGSSADLLVTPGGALTLGFVAGLVSVGGFFLQPAKERIVGIDDTSNVLNTHAYPGLLGGIAGTIACAAANTNIYGTTFAAVFGTGLTPGEQAAMQIAALAVTLLLAVAGGALTGIVVKGLTSIVPGVQFPSDQYPKGYFQDSKYWDTPKDN